MTPPAAADPTHRRHLEVLALSVLALALAPFLELRPGEQVGMRGWPGLVLPPMCGSRAVFGVDCPGCGLTRSFVHLSRGDWRASLRCHRLGWLLMGMAALQVPYRVAALCGRRAAVSPAVGRWVGRLLIASLILNWVLGQLGGGVGALDADPVRDCSGHALRIRYTERSGLHRRG